MSCDNPETINLGRHRFSWTLIWDNIPMSKEINNDNKQQERNCHWALGRRTALERRMRRLACLQDRRPLCCPSTAFHGVKLPLRKRRERYFPRALRMDHGTQYLSDHFLNQIKFWGITPSFAFVAERFNRTLKEQAIYGRIFRTVEDVREAVENFVDLYNNEWRVEKNGFRSPNEVRQAAQSKLVSKEPVPLQ